MEVFIFLSTLIFFLSSPSSSSSSSTFSDQIVGLQCSGSDDSTLQNQQYQINLKNLFDSLSRNGPVNNGFFTVKVGNGDDNTIYGLVQCRGDVPESECSTCINNSTTSHNCFTSKNVTVWLKWCFLRYSNVSFFGLWDQSAMALVNDSDFENLNIVSKEISFMNDLASTAPLQDFMFQTEVLDLGLSNQSGNNNNNNDSNKRYGMAQCSRDISRSDCGRCLNYLLMTFRTTIGNKRGWEIYGSSCSLWYHDFQFYFNYSIPLNQGSVRFSSLKFSIGTVIFTVVTFFLNSIDF